MRLLLLLLFLLPVQGALLEDATGDVQAQHCDQAASPAPGWDAMDLVSLDINETPEQIIFSVTAAGLERQADYDAGNYFVYFGRGEMFYNVRMFQENQGSAAIADVRATEGIHQQFGELVAQFPADIVGNTITTAIERDVLLDDDGAVPIRGHTMDAIVASAEAHATGVYGCSFDGNAGGPYIIRDTMPDSFAPEDGASWTFRYGGSIESGPIRLDVERPFRASNGEATTYAFDITIQNRDDAQHVYDVETIDLPVGWTFTRPNGTLALGGGSSATFTGFLSVPFQHQHGVTQRFDVQVVSRQDPTVQARTELGVHYLTTPQPAGHHSRVWIHSKSYLGPDELAGPSGQGQNELFFNTLEEDDTDQDLEVQAEVFPGPEGYYRWVGCLSPRLAMGLAPGGNETGFELRFRSDVELRGTLTGSIQHITGERNFSCRNNNLGGPELMTLAGDVTGAAVEGTITRVFDTELPYEPDSDLFLVIEIHPDRPTVSPEAPWLLGGHLDLPLEDYHEAAAVPTAEPEDAPFVEEDPGPAKKSPAPLLLVALLAALVRRR